VVREARSHFGSSLGLCHVGCPVISDLSWQPHVSRRAMPWESDQFATAYLKRPAPTVADRTPHKAAHVVREDEAAEEWACPKCGNLNFPGRLVCNMRRCQTPKPGAHMSNSNTGGNSDEGWVCTNCGNENFQGRIFCNMRKCGHAKPGLTASDVARHTAIGGVLGGMPPAAAMTAFTPNIQGAPPGSWKCFSCNNVNYPQRSTCNGRQGQCGLPRPVMENRATGGAGATSNGGFPSTSAATTNGKGASNSPAGSWLCLACKNVNYPARTSCNARGCGLPRDEVDGGPPTAANGGPQGGNTPVPTAMPRTSGYSPAPTPLPESGGMGTGVATTATPAAPEGSWVCPACQNVNWPTRTVCNKRTCGLPRSV